jgi:hypothetical protein
VTKTALHDLALNDGCLRLDARILRASYPHGKNQESHDAPNISSLLALTREEVLAAAARLPEGKQAQAEKQLLFQLGLAFVPLKLIKYGSQSLALIFFSMRRRSPDSPYSTKLLSNKGATTISSCLCWWVSPTKSLAQPTELSNSSGERQPVLEKSMKKSSASLPRSHLHNALYSWFLLFLPLRGSSGTRPECSRSIPGAFPEYF